jgi:predicted transcriptional regulator
MAVGKANNVAASESVIISVATVAIFLFFKLIIHPQFSIFFAFLQNTTRGSKYKIIGNLRFLLKKSKNYADKPKSSRKYSEVKDKEQPASIIQENGCNEMDETDARILWELLEDGRKTFATIAKNCNVSQDVVWKRYKEMKENGIIVGATIQFNYRNFGHSGVAMCCLTWNHNTSTTYCHVLTKSPTSEARETIMQQTTFHPSPCYVI